MKNMEEKIYEIFHEFVNIEGMGKEICENSSLMGDLGFDSIQIMDLFAELEEMFDIEFTDYGALLECIDEVSRFVEYVCELVSGSKTA